MQTFHIYGRRLFIVIPRAIEAIIAGQSGAGRDSGAGLCDRMTPPIEDGGTEERQCAGALLVCPP